MLLRKFSFVLHLYLDFLTSLEFSSDFQNFLSFIEFYRQFSKRFLWHHCFFISIVTLIPLTHCTLIYIFTYIHIYIYIYIFFFSSLFYQDCLQRILIKRDQYSRTIVHFVVVGMYFAISKVFDYLDLYCKANF